MDATLTRQSDINTKKYNHEFYLTRGPEAILVDRHILIGRYSSTTQAVQDLKTQNGVSDCYKTDETDERKKRPEVRMLAKAIIRVPLEHIKFSQKPEYHPAHLSDEEFYVRLSKHHALILYIPNQAHPLYVLDPASPNGVWVNHTRITPAPRTLEASIEEARKHAHPLYPGDTLHLMMKLRKKDSENHMIYPSATYHFQVAQRIKSNQEAITIPPGDQSVLMFKE